MFNVLDPACNIDRHLLLEASAGTGKTFSIEHLTIRLLIEGNVSIDQLLIVTFTRAATKELKMRIAASLQKTRDLLKTYIDSGVLDPTSPAYLQALSEDSLILAKRRIERALFSYSEAAIYTIHGFSEKMLQEGENLQSKHELIEPTDIQMTIRDFFRTGLRSPDYSPLQLERVLKHYKRDFIQLEKAIYNELQRRSESPPLPTYGELRQKFIDSFRDLPFTSKEVYDELIGMSSTYKGITEEIKEAILAFSKLFDFQIPSFEHALDTLTILLSHFKEENRKKKSVFIETPLWNQIVQHLKEPVLRAFSVGEIFSRMVGDCQKMLQKVLKNEEKIRYDDLLYRLLEQIEDPKIASRLASKYRVAIIDEFQDTDPIQWEIFRRLFLNDTHLLYLVGDPKQSIYGFRQADIYTYLDAANALGVSSKVSLDTNYRSHKSLVEGLNELFSLGSNSGWMVLPKTKTTLPYLPVKAFREAPLLDTGTDALHFFLVAPEVENPEECLYGYIAQEILKLSSQGVPFRHWAILTKDRFQGDRCADFLRAYGIPTQTQRQQTLDQSQAFDAMKDLVCALTRPKEIAALKRVFGGWIVGMDHLELVELEDEEKGCVAFELFFNLKKVAEEKGFTHFFEHFLQTKWKDRTVEEILLSKSTGDEFLLHLRQIADWLASKNEPMHRWLELLQRAQETHADEDEGWTIRQDPHQDAIQILSIHASKGLEYEIVVPIGLIKRHAQKGVTFATPYSKGWKLLPLGSDYSDEYELQRQEIDAEKMRHLYVAMTRAKERLYIPIVFEEKVSTAGTKSAMELFLESANLNSFEKMSHWLKDNEKCYSVITEKPSLSRYIPPPPPPLTPPSKIEIRACPIFIQSFTSLSKSHTTITLDAPHNFEIEEKTVHTLPAGRELGILVHRLFEKGNLSEYDFSLIEKEVKSTPFEKWSTVIEAMIRNALYTPIDLEGSSFTISELKPENYYREVEFLYPCGSDFRKGVIDLLFMYEKKYYFLDWKTNWLGPKDLDYSKSALEGAMRDHQYDLQTTIYREAVRRYLAKIDLRPFEDCFGGIFYVFLRGLPHQGIYSCKI